MLRKQTREEDGMDESQVLQKLIWQPKGDPYFITVSAFAEYVRLEDQKRLAELSKIADDVTPPPAEVSDRRQKRRQKRREQEKRARVDNAIED